MGLDITLESEDIIHINGTIHNRDLYDILSQKEEPEIIDTFDNIIKAGTTVTKSFYVQKELTEFLPILEEAIRKNIDAILEEKLRNQEGLSERLKTELTLMVGNQIGDLKSTIDIIKKEDLNPNSPSSHLGSYLNIIKHDIDTLNRKIEYKAAREDTTGKGISFEEKFVNVLNRITMRGTDNYEITKNIHGKIERKTGDFVIQLYRIPYKIVIETKSVNDAADYNKINTTEELDRALRNRNASFAIMVFEDQIPDKLKGNDSWLGPDKLVCTLEDFADTYDKAKILMIHRYYADLEIRLNEKLKRATLEKIRQKNPEFINLIASAKKEIDGCVKEINRIYTIRDNIINSIKSSISSADELTTYRNDLWRKLLDAQTTIKNCLSLYEQKEDLPTQSKGELPKQEVTQIDDEVDQQETMLVDEEKLIFDKDIREYDRGEETYPKKVIKGKDNTENNKNVQSAWGE